MNPPNESQNVEPDSGMNKEQLRETLRTLHEELGDNQRIDDESRELLRTVMQDIHRLLEAEDEEHETDSLVERLEEATLSFSASHPRLSLAANRLMEALSNLGV